MYLYMIYNRIPLKNYYKYCILSFNYKLKLSLINTTIDIGKCNIIYFIRWDPENFSEHRIRDLQIIFNSSYESDYPLFSLVFCDF